MHTKNNFPIRRPASARTRLGGFSLMELMVALALAMILLGLTGPSMSSFLSSSRQSGAASNLFNALRYAKSQAATLNHEVKVCPMTSAGDTTGACASSSDWLSFGYKVVDNLDPTIAPYRFYAGAGPVGARSGSTLAGVASVIFTADGAPLFTTTGGGFAASVPQQYMIYCSAGAPTGSSGASVIVSSSGFVNMVVANGPSSTSNAYQSCP